MVLVLVLIGLAVSGLGLGLAFFGLGLELCGFVNITGYNIFIYYTMPRKQKLIFLDMLLLYVFYVLYIRYIYTVVQIKRSRWFFLYVGKTGKHVLEETFNKTVQKVPTSPNICASTTLGNWSDRLNNQHMYIFMNHWIAANTTGSYHLKNRQTVSKSHHLHVICSKCLFPVRTQASRRWRYVADRTINEQRDLDSSRILDASSQFVDIWDLGMRWKRTFRPFSVLSAILSAFDWGRSDYEPSASV